MRVKFICIQDQAGEQQHGRPEELMNNVVQKSITKELLQTETLYTIMATILPVISMDLHHSYHGVYLFAWNTYKTVSVWLKGQSCPILKVYLYFFLNANLYMLFAKDCTVV